MFYRKKPVWFSCSTEMGLVQREVVEVHYFLGAKSF